MSKKGHYLPHHHNNHILLKKILAIICIALLSANTYAQTKAKPKEKANTSSGQVAPPVPQVTSPVPQVVVEKTNSNDIDRVIAVVNREVITEQELRTRIDIVSQQFLEAKKPLPSKDIVLKEVFERLIDESIMYQESTMSGIRVLDQELDGILGNIANQKNQTVEQLKAATEKSGMRWDKYRQNLRREVMIARFRERSVESKIKITDAEIDAFVNSQIKRSQNPETVNSQGPDMIDVAQILLPIPTGASSSEIATLKAKAQTIYEQAVKESEFMKFATQLSSTDKSVRVQDLGYRTVDRLPQIFIDATKGVDSGGLAPQVIQSPAGFHILKVLDRKSNGSDQAAKTNKSDSIFITQSEVNQMMLIVKQGMNEEDIVRKLKTFREQIRAKTAKFTDIAKKYSEDPNVLKNSGYMGWISPGQVPPEVDVALSRLNPEELSEPFQTEYGWHIVQLLNRRQAEVTGAQQKEYARAALRQSKLLQANEDWIRELRDNATIELRPPYTIAK